MNALSLLDGLAENVKRLHSVALARLQRLMEPRKMRATA